MNKKSLKLRMLKAIMTLPVMVTIVLPSLLLYITNWRIDSVHTWAVVFGIAGLIIGLYLVVSTVRLFLTIGDGTLAPWDPTQKLVVSGPYAYVRNPMISGVVLILLSESLLFYSFAICIWAVVFACINIIYFILSEEPGLRKRFGKEYDEYCNNVPRIVPRLTPWKNI